MAYQQQQGGQQQQAPNYYVIGDKFSEIAEEMNGRFVDIAQNMEQQLADLRQQIAAEKQQQQQLKQQIKESDAQKDEFKKESVEKTEDLKQINSFYAKKADDQSFNNLLNRVRQRHQAFEQAVAQNNYNQDISGMNKKWQDEIYRITQFIKASPDRAEFEAIIDELRNRTNELKTIKGIEEGNIPYEAMTDLVDKCEERHAAQSGDTMARYKPPGKIEDAEVVKNNQEWESLLNVLKDFIINNQKKLAERNAFYLQELGGRINDLSEFKNILNTKISEEMQDQRNLRKKEKDAIKAKKVNEIVKKTKNLNLNVQQRHTQNENQVKNTMDLNNSQKDKQEMDNFVRDDAKWRNEFDRDTQELIQYLV